ncbi:hypothetical protein H9W91_07275 [Streptomyces alfalfae]|uniref:hypothetical protein n=1 Tax=Streptomyces alfalfae TaxID=1642299 RepID=UPI001BAE21C2|nr:hypothetical protein [Streptomyces alfalfae]QUI30680.1 hypothetical protein H9W91_07275 [Streptomyces alfalfae]
MARQTKFTLRMDKGWERKFFNEPMVRRLVKASATEIAETARHTAPHRKTDKTYWNEIRRHIVTAEGRDEKGWYAQVIIEPVPSVRHAMLQERGWKDRRSGRRIPGRHYIKSALLKARVT